MIAIHNMTLECKPPVPAALLWVSLVHCYYTMVVGTLGNALAMWCVATCTKTGRPMKVLLFSVFLPILVTCLVTVPVYGEVRVSDLKCDPDRISLTVLVITVITHFILIQIEQISIAVVAVVRTVAIWAPFRPKLGIRGAVGLVVGMCIYAILTALGLVTQQQAVTTIAISLTMTLPALITATAYILMIFAIQLDKRRLVTNQQQETVTTSMDQATRAMLAVFVSNFVFCQPFSIYLLATKRTFYMDVIFQIIFPTHYMVDPLAYIFFNSDHREKVLSSIRKVIHFISQSVLDTRCIASRDQQTQQNSSPHMKEDTRL